MRALAANIEDVFREAAARWTLLAYFALSSIFILIFAFAVNLDITNGALAGAKLFGNQLPMHGDTPDLEKLVGFFELGFSAVLYPLAVFLAVFATAHLVPRLQERGTIDLYLARPVARTPLLLSRYLAGLLLATANLVYLIGAIWGIVIWKTHVVHPRFLAGGAIILFSIAVLLAFAFLIGVVTSLDRRLHHGDVRHLPHGRAARRSRPPRRGRLVRVRRRPHPRPLLGLPEDGRARQGRDGARRPRRGAARPRERVHLVALPHHRRLRPRLSGPRLRALLPKGLLT